MATEIPLARVSSGSASGDEFAARLRLGGTTGPREFALHLGPPSVAGAARPLSDPRTNTNAHEG